MSVQGYRPVELDRFGGLQTAQGDQTKVPPGRSPFCQNVRFYPGGRVATREGWSIQSTFGGTPDVLGIKEYVDLLGTRRLIVLLDNGTLQYESGSFSFSTIATDVAAAAVAPQLRLSAVSQFGKEWICFGASSLFGSNPAKVFYNDPNAPNQFYLDPVAPEGPANAPTAATSATAGNVPVGTHNFRVFFKTRSGYWTQVGPPVALTVAVANKSVDIAQIPTGPSYVVARVIVATPAFSNTYYFLPGTAMEINDNTTTTATINFTDANLTNGTVVTHPTDVGQDLLRQITINAPGAVASYSGRLAYWGFRHTYVRNSDTGPLNMRFQCGYGATGNANLPNGWTEKTSGESKATGLTGSVYGEPLRITGTGAAAQKGCLENKGQVTNWLPTGVEVWARVRVKRSASATGNLYLYFCPTAQAAGTVDTGEAVFSIGAMSSSEWQVFSVRMNTAAQNTGYDTNTRLRISVGDGSANSLPAAQTLDIDYIEIYTPGYDGDTNTSLVLFSKVEDPEAVDGLQDRMLVEAENGEAITACFPMRGFFYMCKERSLYVTQDNGATEPVEWGVENVSTTIGTPSRFGVGMGDGWAVIVSRSGLFYFDGRQPIKISDEIDPTWARINFTNGQPGPAQKIWCLADPDIKRIYIGVPLDGATEPSHVITLDYGPGSSPLEEDNRDYSLNDGTGIVPLCAGFSIRSTGEKMTLLGDKSGNLLKVDGAATKDLSATAINSIYRTNFIRNGPTRSLLAKIVADISGSGNLTLKTYGPDATTTKTVVPTQALAAAPNRDFEWKHQHIGEAIALEFQTNFSGSYFQLSRLTTWWQTPAPSGAVREHAA